MVIIIDCKNRKIKFCDEIIETMHRFIQWNRSDEEAGGIIVGRENLGNDNLILEYITSPMENDIRTRTRFTRKDLGHLNYYKQLYIDHNGIYAYFGEWHTHPEDIPHYSILDLNNWKRIAKDDPKNIQYHIIVGRRQLRLWEMGIGYFTPRLLYEGKWHEIISKKAYS